MSEKNIGVIASMSTEGDIKYSWDRTNPKECEAAHVHFEEMRSKGFLIFKVKWMGLRRKKVARFDPKDEEYTFQAPKPARHESPYRDPELAGSFDPQSDYVATPPAVGG